jgi:O-antigen/teichoic acid export membrane protein
MNNKSEITQQDMKKKKIAIRFSLLPLFLGLIILLPAGTLKFWQCYTYFAVLVIPMIFVIFYFLKKDPKFLERRTRAKEKEKKQKLLSIFSTTIFRTVMHHE